MKILVVGGGGREHAIIMKLAESHKVSRLYCAPGNGGISKFAECHPVKATDIEGMLDLAKNLAVDMVFVAPDDPLVAGMVDAMQAAGFRTFGPDKADVIYDCAGNNITMGQAIKYARKGSTIILVAVFAGMATVDLAVLNDHELDLNTTMMYRNEDYIDAIELVRAGKVQLQPLVSKHFAFRDYAEAYRYIDANRETTMKVIINVQE